MTEILFSLGLADKIAGTAVWVGPVLKGYEAENRKIKRLADNDPSFESVVGEQPDLVAAEFEWHVGAQGSVGKREQFAGLGINTYVSPADCVAKVNTHGGDGVRRQLFTMDLIYQEIRELSEIFDIKDRGDALIVDLKKRESRRRRFDRRQYRRDLPSSSGSRARKLRVTPSSPARTALRPIS